MCHDLFCAKINLFAASPLLPSSIERLAGNSLSSQSAPKILTSDWLTLDAQFNRPFQISLSSRMSLRWTSSRVSPAHSRLHRGVVIQGKRVWFLDHLFLFVFRKMAKRGRSLLEELSGEGLFSPCDVRRKRAGIRCLVASCAQKNPSLLRCCI